MAGFCAKCGAAVTGRFCTACGAAAPETVPQAQSTGRPVGTAGQGVAAPPAAARQGSGVKILLIVLGDLLFLGLEGVVGVVYVGYRAKQKIAELKKEYGIENGGASAMASRAGTRSFPPSQGSGCRLLQGQEAAQILGVAVERVDTEPAGPDGSMSCRYWVSAAERQRLIQEEFASSLTQMG